MDENAIAALQGHPASITSLAPAEAPTSNAKPISPPPVNLSQPELAPVIDPAVEKSETPKDTTTPPPAKNEPAEPVIDNKELLKAVGLAETPEKKLGRLERERSAEGKENRRLSEYIKRLKEDILDSQGLIVTEDGHKLPTGLLATKKYSKDIGELAVKFKDLSGDQQTLFESDPQQAIDMIVDKAKKALIRVMPTTDKMPVLSISPERHETALAYLSDVKWESGDVRFPGLADNRELIEEMINAPTASQALKDFYNQEPELALSFLNLQLEHARSHIREQVKKTADAAEAKKKAANENPTLEPSGGGTPSLSGTSSNNYVEQLVAEMRKTRLNPY